MFETKTYDDPVVLDPIIRRRWSFLETLDRDMSAYRAWHEAGVISAAVLITQDRLALKALAERLRSDRQATIAPALRQSKLPIDLATATTTNLEKAALRVRRGVMRTCPLLIVAATQATWNGMAYSVASNRSPS